MKPSTTLSTLLIFISQSRIQSSQDINRDLGVDLKTRFHIDEPVFHYEKNKFELSYGVSDIMADAFVEYRVYDGHECKEGSNEITENDYLISKLRPDLKPVGDGSGNRTMKVTLDLDPFTIATSPIFEDFGTYADVNFCVRFMVYNMDYLDPSALEVNFLESPVYLKVNLADGFDIEFSTSNAELVLNLAYDDSAVEAYLCDQESNIVEGDMRSQGETIRVCVIPTAETLAQGAYLRYIDQFTFVRDEFEQLAIESGTQGAAASELTVVSCEAGSTLCAFETLLSSEFFDDGIGIVTGSGIAFLQFGPGPITGTSNITTTRRRMEEVNDGSTADLLANTPTGITFEIVAMPQEQTEALSESSKLKATVASVAMLIPILLL